MSSPLSVKRRRLNDVNKTLTKPFVSPMRTLNTEQTQLKEDASKANVKSPPYTPSTLAHTIKPAYSAPQQKVPKLAPVRSTFNAAKSTPIRKQPSFSALLPTKKTATPEEILLQKQISALERQIRKTQSELDTLQQAHKLLTTPTDDELRELSEKWRLCSQSVAEELFGTVKERVCRMGGVAAWREMEKRKYERANGLGEFAQEKEEVQEDDDADCEFDNEGEELPEEEQEYRKRMKRQAQQEMRDAADVEEKEPEIEAGVQKGQVWQDDGKEDDTFTMDMMLRSLNIDLALIGYDKETQRWT